jgi:hypothetical protein
MSCSGKSLKSHNGWSQSEFALVIASFCLLIRGPQPRHAHVRLENTFDFRLNSFIRFGVSPKPLVVPLVKQRFDMLHVVVDEFL